ncbi:unnamed protein product [Zymoseptoria tritici ST99CH_1A5]|nr:unnamed protein product [Zymoseptoria tritici ST99CH_1A5]
MPGQRLGQIPPPVRANTARQEYQGRSARNSRVEKDYATVKDLAAGGMSMAITLVERKTTKTLYVRKTIEIVKDYESRVRAEIRVLERISKDRTRTNINKMVEYDLHHKEGFCHLVLDYCDGGNLHQKINETHAQGHVFTESYVWNVLAAGCSALMFLHVGLTDPSQRRDPSWDSILHLDIKPANVFLDSHGGPGHLPRVVLGDFGCAVQASDILRKIEPSMTRPGSTPGWCPPEESFVTYGVHTDLWLLGALIQVTCMLDMAPHPARLEGDSPCTSAYSRDLNSLVSGLVVPEPRRRTMAHRIVGQAEQGLRDALSRKE